jgi:two-component system, OmpR family, sensor histidine kinase KdpD
VKGRLRIIMGYAAGVGKTYQMLEEARRLQADGVDIAIGYFEPHGRRETIALTTGLETVPRRTVEYRGTRFEEMDTDAIVRRRPAVCAVDEFAHTNVPGSERQKRWQDVQVLLDSAIDVITTMNVQHLESLNDRVWQITGVRVRETVPDWVIDQADEVVFADLTPEALRNRLLRGVVYAPDKARLAMENFFTEANLGALREMALRHVAHEVDGRLAEDRLAEGDLPRSAERILICLTGSPSSAILIRRGRRVADYLRADCLAVHVGSGTLPDDVERHLSFARNLRIETHVVPGADPAAAIAVFARMHRVTQIFVGRSAPRPAWRAWRESPVRQLVRLAPDMQITIVAGCRR